MNDPVLAFQQVTKTYRAGSVTTAALQGLDLEVASGEFLAVVGPSGSGKTTLLNLAGCLDVPDAGTVLVDGTPVAGLSDRELTTLRREKIGFVFQDFNLLEVLTAAENVAYPLLLQGIDPSERKTRVQDILRLVGIPELADRRPQQMSGGQQQRVAVARGLVGRPRLVLADEPTGNLDSETGAEIIRLMRDLNRGLGITFLFSTHDQAVMSEASRIVILRDGRVVAG